MLKRETDYVSLVKCLPLNATSGLESDCCAGVIVFTCVCTRNMCECFCTGQLNVSIWKHKDVYLCVFVLKCVFAALFLLTIHLQPSHPSICRLPSPPYHLSSSPLHSSHPFLLSHTSLIPSATRPLLSHFIPVTYSQSRFRHYHTATGKQTWQNKHAQYLLQVLNGSLLSAFVCTSK